MFLTLVRHGDARASTNSLGDSGRCLSPKGREQARRTGRALAERKVAPTLVWTSPLVRAVQTTELILASLPFSGAVEARDDLYPGSTIQSVLGAIGPMVNGDTDVLVVGHMPYMADLAGTLLGLRVGGLATAEAYRIELFSPSQSTARQQLCWRFNGQFC
ncbi:phosphohistidine phosphatase, SixA [Plesiocystis pacifica SIR-1]|uniref:Phosphohistidine phosphatase, SixA n=1 Tax=Plesiocystis pacifica SIR-1 TaxID=391625 RepID=A6G5G2_9BACT|nr:histidine phosphatase family protein [Plesiocystis pacifica]EDM78905.1 phosphohistidine phosphatase, SixA [Plesiocystis pacifica SIR-1]